MKDIHIDQMIVSPYTRAIETGKYLRESYLSDSEREISMGMMTSIHEFGGMYTPTETKPGLTKAEALEIVPDLSFREDIAKEFSGECGWWNCQPKERPADTLERAKLALRQLKALATDETYAGKVVCIISHGGFLATLLMCLNTPLELDFPNPRWSPENNSLTIVDFE